MTQDGIAAALALSRAHVALELKRWRPPARAQKRVPHAAERRAGGKASGPPPGGKGAPRRMREHARSRPVQLTEPQGVREVLGSDAIEALRRSGLRESEAVQQVLASDVIELPRPAAPKAPVPSRPFFGRTEERQRLQAWLAAETPSVAVLIGVAGAGHTTVVTGLQTHEPRPTFMRRVYAHDDAHGLLSSFADFLARQGRRRLKSVITRPAYDPTEAVAVMRGDLSGCVVAIDDLHASPAADALLRALFEIPGTTKILVATRTQPTFYERSDLVAKRVLELPLKGLDDAASGELLRARGAAIEPDAIQHVIAATHGHPLALELFAARGIDAGAVETERYGLETVLDGLDDSSEELLRTFAVLRRPARSPEALGATLSQLRRLVRRALLHHRDDGYLIHDLVKEFFLRRIADVARRDAHARAAAYWQFRADGLEETYHRIEAGDIDTARVRLIEIGPGLAESARAGDLEAALLRVPRSPRLEGILVETEVFLGKFTEARAALERIGASGGQLERLRARIQLGRIENRLGAYKEARVVLEEAARDAAAVQSPEIEGEALRALGGVERKLGDLDAAIAHLGRATDVLPNGSRERVRALTDLGVALIARDDIPGAKARLLEAAATVRRATREDAVIQINLGIVTSREGDPRTAAATFARSADIALATGEIRFAAYALANAVDNFLRMEAVEEAASSAERALALATTIGDPLAVSTARANMGLVFA